MGISIAVALIVMVAALNIVASLILMVMRKSRDIAILKTMGASARSVMMIFMLQGTDHRRRSARRSAASAARLCWVLDR